MKITDRAKTAMKVTIMQTHFDYHQEVGPLPSDKDAKRAFKNIAKETGETTNNTIRSFQDYFKDEFGSDFPYLADRRVLQVGTGDGLLVFGEKGNVHFTPNEDGTELVYAVDSVSKEDFKKAYENQDISYLTGSV